MIIQPQPTEPKDFWCVAALCEDGSAWIVQRSPDARLYEIIPEGSTEDNGMDAKWETENTPGLYRLELCAIGGGPDMHGEYWCSVDVLAVTPLHVLPISVTGTSRK